MYIPANQKQNPYYKPNPFKKQIKFKPQNLIPNDYSIESIDPSYNGHYLSRKIDYWKFNQNHHKSSSYLPNNKGISYFQKQISSNRFSKKNYLNQSASNSNVPRNYNINSSRNTTSYNQYTQICNPFYRKNLLIEYDQQLDKNHEIVTYNKYIAADVTPTSSHKRYSSSIQNMDQQNQFSRQQQSRRYRESQSMSNQAINNFSITMNLLEKRPSTNAAEIRKSINFPDLRKSLSRNSYRQSPSKKIQYQKSYPGQINVRGRKFFHRDVFKN